MSGTRILLWVTCGGLLACESAADVIQAQRPNVERSFARLRTLAPRVSAGELGEPTAPAVPLILEGPGHNAMFIYADELARPGFPAPTVVLRSLDAVPILQCGALLTSQTYFGDPVTRPMPSVVQGYLTACAQVRYALVIRQGPFTPPTLSLATRTFSSGRYQADVVAFDLTTGALVGTYDVDAKNDERVSLLDGDADHQKRLLSNLESTVFEALRAGARAKFPRSLPPVR